MQNKISTFQIGSPRKRGEGVRVAVVRYPQRGVPAEKRAKAREYDIWLPVLAPSQKLLARFKGNYGKDFFDAYAKELEKTAWLNQTVEFLALMSTKTRLSIGCYCGDESCCHRSRLLKILEKKAENY